MRNSRSVPTPLEPELLKSTIPTTTTTKSKILLRSVKYAFDPMAKPLAITFTSASNAKTTTKTTCNAHDPSAVSGTEPPRAT